MNQLQRPLWQVFKNIDDNLQRVDEIIDNYRHRRIDVQDIKTQTMQVVAPARPQTDRYPIVQPAEPEPDWSDMATVLVPAIKLPAISPYTTAPLPPVDEQDRFVRYEMSKNEHTFAGLMQHSLILKNALIWYLSTFEDTPLSMHVSEQAWGWLTLLNGGDVFHFGEYAVPISCELTRLKIAHIEYNQVWLERPLKEE